METVVTLVKDKETVSKRIGSTTTEPYEILEFSGESNGYIVVTKEAQTLRVGRIWGNQMLRHKVKCFLYEFARAVGCSNIACVPDANGLKLCKRYGFFANGNEYTKDVTNGK